MYNNCTVLNTSTIQSYCFASDFFFHAAAPVHKSPERHLIEDTGTLISTDPDC